MKQFILILIALCIHHCTFDLETMANAHLPFKDELLTCYHTIGLHLFHTSFHDQVILGKHNYLYFKDTVHDYLQDQALSEDEIEMIASHVNAIHRYFSQRGKQFLFVVVPNKNEIDDFMPARYRKGKQLNDAQRILSKLDEGSYLDLFSLFSSYQTPLYYRYDTHWKRESARIAYVEIMKQFHRRYDDFLQYPFVSTTHEGDLSRMLFRNDPLVEEEYYHDHKEQFQVLTKSHDYAANEILTYHASQKQTLVMLRDSFADHLIPYLSEQFQYAYYTKDYAIDLKSKQVNEADVIIMEIAQRNIKEVRKYFQTIVH